MVALSSTARAAAPAEELDALFRDYWEATLRRSPTFATELGDHRYDDRLEDLSEAAHAERIAEVQGFLKRLKAIPAEQLSDRDALNREIFERTLQDTLAAVPTHPEWTPLNHLHAPHLSLPLLQVSHPFKSEKDVQNYAVRLRGFGKQVDDCIACLKAGIEHKHVLPKIVVNKTIPQIRSQIVTRAEDSELYRPLTKLPDAISEEKKTALRALVAEAILRNAVPAYERLAKFVEQEYLPASREDVGIWAVPNGDELYNIAVRL
ncbi:MAG TPA: DUF885 family protein, partial [Phycisphaerae bacterium]